VTISAEREGSGNRFHPVAVTAIVGVLGWLVVVAIALLLGAVVTHFVVGHALGQGDLDVAQWFARRRSDTWNTVSQIGSGVAETFTVLAVLAIALGVLAWRRCWPQCGLLAVTMSAEAGTYLVATYVVSRNRPAVPRLEDLILADSYPSGHTAAAVALYGSLAIVVCSLTQQRVWRRLFLALAVVAPIMVATSRVYRGMHNVTDVVCGALLGACCVAVGCVAVRAGMADVNARAEDRPHPTAEGARLQEAVS
jgi:undecaprenyl-diphosphatase